MKKSTILFLLLLLGSGIMAQAPQKMAYQAVIRDASGALLTNTTIGVRVSIRKNSETGSEVFAETHTVTTNANGLANLQIGGGTAVLGGMASVSWSAASHFIQTDIDPTGGTNYSITAVSELLSVPYALHSANGVPGPEGPAGPSGAPGLAGPVGPQGPSGVVSFAGGGVTIPGNATGYAFVGPTAMVTITSSTQKVTLVAHAPLTLQSGSPNTFMAVGACYRLTTGPTPINFVGSNSTAALITTLRTVVGVSATVTGLAPGEYKMGFGIYNSSTYLVSPDRVNGWVMVTE
jgi:hypothetical protein